MEYIPIRVSTLRGDQGIDFDAYLKINDKYVLYVKQGDSFEGERLKRLKSKKLKKMFILPEAEVKYRDYMSKNIEMAYDAKSGKSIESRSEIIQGAQQSNAEAVMENPENQAAYQEAKDASSLFVQFMQQEGSGSLQAIMNIENVDQNVAHHGVTVSALAVALAQRLGITDEKKTQMLSLGAMLHDFEHFHSGLNIARPLAAFSADELKLYKQHPMNGAQRVRDKNHFDASVINIILEHEEYIDGKGFPNGTPESKMDPLSVIVGSANALDRMITFESVPKNEVVKKLLISSVGQHPLQHIQLLGEIMNQMKLT
jgi:HD-GYP domain-containing protein (c-di-GMP phosphodiesterase class II)